MGNIIAGFLAFLGTILLTVALGAVINLILAIPLVLLWDWLMPQLFSLGEITYWQAWGLLFLCGLLIKGTTAIPRKSND